MAAGGTKLPRSSPCSNSSASQAASQTSVLRPGRSLTCRALTNSSWKPTLLKDIPDRLPILAGGLHHHLGDPLAGQPPSQRLQPRGEGRERPHLLGSSAAPIRDAHADHYLVLGDIQPGAARVKQLHRRHLPMAYGWCPAGPTESTTLKHVLTATVRGAGRPPRQSYQRALSHQGKPSLAGPPRFSSLVAAPGHGGLIRVLHPGLFPQATPASSARAAAGDGQRGH